MKGLRSISVLLLSKGAFQKNWADFWLSEFHREGSTWNGECLAWRLLLNKRSKLNKLHNCHFLHFTLFKPGSHPSCSLWHLTAQAHCQPPRKKKTQKFQFFQHVAFGRHKGWVPLVGDDTSNSPSTCPLYWEAGEGLLSLFSCSSTFQKFSSATWLVNMWGVPFTAWKQHWGQR